MKLTPLQIFTWIALFGAAAAASLGFALAGHWLAALLGPLIALAWLAGRRLNRRGVPTLALFAFTLLAALGFWMGLSTPFPPLMLAGALAAWDLAFFTERLGLAQAVNTRGEIEGRHLRRLGVALAAGLALSILGPLTPLTLNFDLAVLIAITGFAGLVVGITRLRPDPENKP